MVDLNVGLGERQVKKKTPSDMEHHLKPAHKILGQKKMSKVFLSSDL